ITDLIGYRMGLHVATGATATNVYGEVMDVLPTPAGGVQFGYVSSYDNAFGDKNLVGGWTGKPTTSPRYALDVQGAQVDAATLGMKTNPVAASGPNTPTLPAVGDGSIAFVKGTGGTNSYFLITYNDGGTPRYAMIQLNTATPTLSGSPSLPV
ncbi:MAG: hypothetical protein KGH75_00005, partial [Rhodospirillales bacterium]|nr:hypothetical protein [Rhodospirillales bacterium]